jgi:hypothetical protein
MSDTTTLEQATAALGTDRQVIQHYYVLRRAPDVQKIALRGRPPGVTGWCQSGPIGPEWKLNAAFDFNGDGLPDIFGHNQETHELCIWWGRDCCNFVKGEPLQLRIRSGWQLQVARFRRDGGMDIFGHNRGSDPNEVQKIRIWHLDGGRHTHTSFRDDARIGIEWELHLGDFNGDGILDILGVHRDTGDLYVWLVREGRFGALVVGGEAGKDHYPIGQIGPEWQLQVADIDNDGYADVFGYRADNLLKVWNNREGEGGRRALYEGHVHFGDLGNEWGSLQIAYLDGDGFPDLLGQSTDGAVRGWYSNGTTLDSGSDLGSAPGWTPLAGGTHLR